MNYWLMKSEPSVYSITDLQNDGQTVWDGVRNYQARNFLRQMQIGDRAFFYHSNAQPSAIVGLMKIVQNDVIDPTQFDPNSLYFDAQSSTNAPRWQTVTVEFVEHFSLIISLNNLKQSFTPEELLLVKRGNRLSVMPVADNIAQKILSLSLTAMKVVIDNY